MAQQVQHVIGLHERWASNLKRRREALGMSQTQLAGLCGISQQAIGYIEKTGSVSDLMKYRISRNLGTHPNDLFAWPPIEELQMVGA